MRLCGSGFGMIEIKKWAEPVLAAAANGHAAAQYELGVMYAIGHGVPRDAAQAVDWLRKAAKQGHAAAEHSLGVMYAAGYGVPRDAGRAVMLWMPRGKPPAN